MYDISCQQYATGTGAGTACMYMSISSISTCAHMLNCHVTYTLAAHVYIRTALQQALFRLAARKVLSVSLKHCNFELQAASTTATVTANSSALNSNCLTVCDSGNPNGYYRLNLADPRGRETARQLQELAVSQRGEVRCCSQSVDVITSVYAYIHAAVRL
jgi:hypothetical protein